MPITTKKKFKSELLNILNERGFIHQTTNGDAIDKYFNSNEVIGYIGFDLTAKSLHVGSLLQIMLLKWLQEYNYKPIVLMGGGTTLIGDPSGKDESRKILDQNNIMMNQDGIFKVFKKFLNFDDKKIIIENNLDWLRDLNYITFLRDFGKHFTINRMLSFDSVKLRLDREQPLSFLEFNYMILQAYDFWELKKRHDCRLQLGGSDQWGNIINGIELIRRVDRSEAYGITTPLVTTSSGSKMGKTADGAIWLDEDLTNPHEFWQFWRNTDDKDVIHFIKLFTTLPMNEIQKLESLQGSELNEAKKILANEVTKNTHGNDIADLVHKSALETFEQKIISEKLPIFELNKKDCIDSIGLLALLVKVGFSKSNSDARKSILNGAIRINDHTISDPSLELSKSDISKLKLSFGKKKHILLNLGL
jgi:tyrosyl-tRNA synthetase